jgi:hypothetical protein
MGGLLPPVNDMAWTFRTTEEVLLADLVDLSKVGIVTLKGDRWIVTHFADRQDPITPAEGMARLRDRRHKTEYYVSQNEETQDEPTQEVIAPTQSINTPSEEPVSEPLRILTQIRLDKNRIDTDEIRPDPALPAASTPPTAPNISLSELDSNPILETYPPPEILIDLPPKRSSFKPPKLPTGVPDGRTLTSPEIFDYIEQTYAIWKDISGQPEEDDKKRIAQWGRLFGRQHILDTFEAARGKYRTLTEIYNSIGKAGDNGNGHDVGVET